MLGAEAHTGSSSDAEAPKAAQAPHQWANHRVRFPCSPPAFPPRVRPPHSLSRVCTAPPVLLPLLSRPRQSLQAVASSPFKTWWLQRVGGILGTHTAGEATHRAHGRAHRCAIVARNGVFLLRSILTLHVESSISWPYGLMDKALVFGTKDSRVES